MLDLGACTGKFTPLLKPLTDLIGPRRISTVGSTEARRPKELSERHAALWQGGYGPGEKRSAAESQLEAL